MRLAAFLTTRPCIEQLDGYEEGLRWQRDHPDLLHRPIEDDPQDPEVMRLLRDYRKALMAGRTIPAPPHGAGYTYRWRHKPVRTKAKIHTLKLEDEHAL